ncbi:sodium:solute symporter [Ornithobacterium rhinotracheale]|uniref:Sodium:solute symporter n=1 Tax=Ornithobacterium rhinotracheale TaxID=28251 RepID=A0A410JS74_ORNRH|nr:sodium/solute symporter [Ornithobacterium rhinotracheale]QAR31027.1 sodium:solute symporter [Ornithobacterium rhinotracheale]
MRTLRHILALYFSLFMAFALVAQSQINANEIYNFESLKNKNFNEGLAGSAFGKVGEYFIVAGGSSFPDGKPWQNGKKYLSKEVFIFKQNKDKELELIYQGEKLPQAIAEPAYVSLKEGLLILGGQTENGYSDKVYLIRYQKGKVVLEGYPSLPAPVRAAAACELNGEVYILGGQLENGTSSKQFLALNLDRKDRWHHLPDYPHPVSGAALVAQQDGNGVSLFALGGRSQALGELTTFYADVFNYSKNQWVRKQNIQIEQKDFPLAVASAGAVGASSIVIVGGDHGETFHQVEKAIQQENISLRDSLWVNHQGFNKRVLVYNTITDAWFAMKEDLKNPTAVTGAVSDKQSLYIMGGEERAGVRSPQIMHYEFQDKSNFGWVNYAVLILYFGGMLLLGFFFMKNNNNTEDYFKASGRIPWWAAGISIFATTLSAITFISIPAKTYASDWRMFMFNMSIILAAPFIIKYFLPFFLRFNFDTAYQYLEVRFNRLTRWVAATLFLLFMVSRIAIVLFLPSLALNAVTGFSVYYSILIMSIVTIIYSTSGGMEAVVWGDVIQGFILIVGAFAALIFMLMGVEGGLSGFWDTTLEYHKMKTFDFDFNFSEPVFWVVLLGGFANTIISYTSDQSVVQRYMTTKDEKSTQKSIWLNGIISVPVSVLFFLLGTGLFAFYKSNPADFSITNPNVDSVFPQFIVSEMPIGFAGLLIAAIFAAAMSTLSSNINSASAVLVNDFYKIITPNIALKKQMKVAQISGILIGLLGMAMALILATWNITSLWDQFNTFLGLLTSGLGALFILGIFFPRVNGISALLGVICGVVILYIVKEKTSLSFLLYGLVGLVASIGFALIFSLFIKNEKDNQGLTWKTRELKK